MISVYLVSRFSEVVLLEVWVVAWMFSVSWKPSLGFLVGKIMLSLFSFDVDVDVVMVVDVERVVVVEMWPSSKEERSLDMSLSGVPIVLAMASLLRTQTRMPVTVAMLMTVSTAITQQHLQFVLLCEVRSLTSPSAGLLSSLLTEPRLLSEAAVYGW